MPLLLDQYAVPEHNRGTGRATTEGVHVTHRKDWNKAEQACSPTQHLDHTSGAKPVQHLGMSVFHSMRKQVEKPNHIFQILYSCFQFLIHFFQTTSILLARLDQILSRV